MQPDCWVAEKEHLQPTVADFGRLDGARDRSGESVGVVLDERWCQREAVAGTMPDVFKKRCLGCRRKCLLSLVGTLFSQTARQTVA